MSEYARKLFQRKARLEIQAQVLGDILGGLDSTQRDFVKHVEIKGQHRFGAEATVLLEATQRADVLPLLTVFPAQGLSNVLLRDGGRAIVTTETQMGAVMVSRVAALPFLYTLVQVRRRARSSVVWACKLRNGINVAVECDIQHDRAAFVLEHVEDLAHNQILFRRRPNEWVPAGIPCEHRGTDWSVVKDVPASVMIWWPYDFHKFQPLRDKERGERFVSLTQYADIALEVRQEAHANETTK